MDLDGAKQDSGWRPEPNPWTPHFTPFGQPPAYGFSALPRPTSAEQHNAATSYSSVKNRVAELLTKDVPLHSQYPNNFLSSQSLAEVARRSSSFSYSSGNFPPSQKPTDVTLPYGHHQEMIRSVSLSNINGPPYTKTSANVDSRSLQNLREFGKNEKHNPNDLTTQITKDTIVNKSFQQNQVYKMADTSAIYPPQQGLPTYRPFAEFSHSLQDRKVMSDNFQSDQKSFSVSRTSSSESLHSDSSRSSVPHVNVNSQSQSRPALIHNASLYSGSLTNNSFQPPISSREHSKPLHLDALLPTNNHVRSSVTENHLNLAISSAASPQNHFFHPISTKSNEPQEASQQSSIQLVGNVVENHHPATTRSSSRSWSPWDNVIRSTNSSPATVHSTTSNSQSPSPAINYSPVPSPFSSSASSIGSLNHNLSSTQNASSVIPTSVSPSLASSSEDSQTKSKDPFQFQDESNPMKPPETLPKGTKPSKKKPDGRLKECRRKKGILPFQEVSLDEINPELARMIRESKMKEELKANNKKDGQKIEKKRPIYSPKPPLAQHAPPIHNTAAFLNQQMKSVMKPTSPYEFSDEPENFSPAILKDTYNATINVNSKMYSMGEMLAMTNSPMNTGDVKKDPMNGEVKKKKKKKKTVEKMLASPNPLGTPYSSFPQSNNTQSGGSHVDVKDLNSAMNTNLSTVDNQFEPSTSNLVMNSNSASELVSNIENSAKNPLDNMSVVNFHNASEQTIEKQPSFNVTTSSCEKLDKTKFCCTSCKSHGTPFSTNCQNHNFHHQSNDSSTLHCVQKDSLQKQVSHDAFVKTRPLASQNSAIIPTCDNANTQDTSVPVDISKPDIMNQFSAPIIKSEHNEMDLDQYLKGCQDPNAEGALLNNLEASIHSLFTQTFPHDNQTKVCPPHHEPIGNLKRSSSWHDIHDISTKKKILHQKYAKKNPLLDPNMKPLKHKINKIKKVKLHGSNGYHKPTIPKVPIRIGPPLSKEEELLDRLKHNRPEVPSCTCVSQEELNSEADGPYYTQLGYGKSIACVREKLEKQTGAIGKALRIEKVQYSGKEGKSSQGCPIAKWIIRRSGIEEKFLCIVKRRKGHFCDKTYIVINLVAWEGVPADTADDLYNHLTSSLTKNGFETERRCGTNEKKTCACQGIDLVRRGASFSFGCSWSMYFNGCKYARSREVRKFKLKDTSKEEEMNSRLQSLASVVGPLYETMAPDAHRNQCELKGGKECRLGSTEKKPFSGVTACVDFCAHAHKDLHNMNNGSTVVVTLTKHRGFDKAEDEQLHVLPLYILDPTDETGSYENQMEKVRQGGLEILHNFPHEARMRSTPLTPKKKGRKANKDHQSPNGKKERVEREALNSILAMKAKLKQDPNQLNMNNMVANKVNKCESRVEPVKSENKNSLTFDNLMTFENTPRFAEMQESFWNYFYSNGSFPPSEFLHKWGVNLPNHQHGFKQDVNNPSNTVIQKPSHEMLPNMNPSHPNIKVNLSDNNPFSDQPMNRTNNIHNDLNSMKNQNNIHDIHGFKQKQNILEDLKSGYPVHQISQNDQIQAFQQDGQRQSALIDPKIPGSENHKHDYQDPRTPGLLVNNSQATLMHPSQKQEYQDQRTSNLPEPGRPGFQGSRPSGLPEFQKSGFESHQMKNFQGPNPYNHTTTVPEPITPASQESSSPCIPEQQRNVLPEKKPHGFLGQQGPVYTDHHTAGFPSNHPGLKPDGYPSKSPGFPNYQRHGFPENQTMNISGQNGPGNLDRQRFGYSDQYPNFPGTDKSSAFPNSDFPTKQLMEKPGTLQQSGYPAQHISHNEGPNSQHSDDLFKIPNAPDSNQHRKNCYPNINNPFRSPESNSIQQKQFLQRSAQHPINSFSQANNQNNFHQKYYPQLDLTNSTKPVNPNQLPSNKLPVNLTNGLTNQRYDDWTQVKKQCFSNNPSDPSQNDVNRTSQSPNQQNSYVHNQFLNKFGATFPSQNRIGAEDNPVPQSGHINAQSNRLPQFSPNNSVISDNSGLPHNMMRQQHCVSLGSSSEIPSSSVKSALSLTSNLPSKIPENISDHSDKLMNRASSLNNHFENPLKHVSQMPLPTQDPNHRQPMQNEQLPKQRNENEHSFNQNISSFHNKPSAISRSHSVSNQPNPFGTFHQANMHNQNINSHSSLPENKHMFVSGNLNDFKLPNVPNGMHNDMKFENGVKNDLNQPSEPILDPTVVHCQMEYNEESFHDPDVGGIAIALSHGSVLFEVAKRELHATTALKNPNRYHPTRISLVFYQHKNLNFPNHGAAEWEKKLEKLRIEKLEKGENKRKESFENEVIPPELRMKKKKKENEEEEVDFATTSAAQYKYMWEAPAVRSAALTTDSIITRWIDPQPMVTGPYQRWVLPSC